MDTHTESLLQDLFDDRLPPDEAAAVRERIAADPTLAEAWDDLHRLGRLVAGSKRERAPADFLSRVRVRIAAEADAESPPLPTHPRWQGLGLVSAAAALVLLALAARLLFLTPAPTPMAATPVDDARLSKDAAEQGEPPPTRAEPVEGLGEALRRGARGGLRVGEAEEHEGWNSVPAPGAGPAPITAPAPAPPAPPMEPRAERSASTPRASAGRGSGLPPVPRFQPGDTVPPGLRRPSDDVAPRGPAPEEAPSRARRALRRKGPAADAEIIFEAPALDTGRATLALWLAALPATGDSLPDARDKLGGPPLQSATEGAPADVLGSFVLTLPADVAARLIGRPVAPQRRGEDDTLADQGVASRTVRVILVRAD